MLYIQILRELERAGIVCSNNYLGSSYITLIEIPKGTKWTIYSYRRDNGQKVEFDIETHRDFKEGEDFMYIYRDRHGYDTLGNFDGCWLNRDERDTEHFLYKLEKGTEMEIMKDKKRKTKDLFLEYLNTEQPEDSDSVWWMYNIEKLISPRPIEIIDTEFLEIEDNLLRLPTDSSDFYKGAYEFQKDLDECVKKFARDIEVEIEDLDKEIKNLEIICCS